MQFAFSYVYLFYQHLVAAWPLLAFLAAIVVLLGLIAGRIESWPRFDSIYWAFITATTVGYGDIRPKKPFSRILAVLIAFIGLTFTGIVVALAINAATLAFHGIDVLPAAAPR